MALFVTFEGVEGCGKSTQSRRLYRRLQKLAIPSLLTHEPGVTDLGKRITRLLKWTENIAISPLAELLLFNVSRAQLVEEVIRPALKDGKIVLCDRYADSSLAYQGYGREEALDTVRLVNKIATQGLVPDLTVLLDLPVTEGLTRKGDRNPDRFEKEDIEFHERVRHGFLELAETEPERWLIIDARKSRREIAGMIWQNISDLM